MISAPTDVAGCQLWLSADYVPGVAPGGAVAEWQDRSGNDNHATQATSTLRPVWYADQFAGQPAVRFDGEGDYLVTPSIAGADETCTIALVFRSRGNPLYAQILAQLGDDLTSAGAWAVTRSGAEQVTGKVQAWTEATNYSGIESSPTRAYLPVIVLARIDRSLASGSEIELYVNGVLQYIPLGDGDALGNVASGAVYIGGLAEAALGNNQTARMDLAEVIYYTRWVSDVERDDILEYLGRWTQTETTTGAGQPWVIVLRALGGGWRRTYSPANPNGINNIEAIIERSGNCARAKFSGPVGLAPVYPCVGEIWLDGQRVFTGIVVSAPARYPGDGDYELEGLRWLLDRNYNLDFEGGVAQNYNTKIGSYIKNQLGPWVHPEITVPSNLYTFGGKISAAVDISAKGGTIGAIIDSLASSSGDLWGVDADGQIVIRSPSSAVNQVAYAPPAILQWASSDYSNRITEVVAFFQYYNQIYQVASAIADDPMGGLTYAFEMLFQDDTGFNAIADYTLDDNALLWPFADPTVLEYNLGQTSIAKITATLSPGAVDSNGNYWEYVVNIKVLIDGLEVATSNNQYLARDTIYVTVDLYGIFSGLVVVRAEYAPHYTNIDGDNNTTNAQSDIGYGLAELRVSQFNEEFAAIAVESCAAQLAAFQSGGEVADVTVSGLLPLSDTVTVYSEAEPREYTATTAEFAYRCSTDSGIQTVVALGAALRPPAVIRTIRLMGDVQRNPKRRRV